MEDTLDGASRIYVSPDGALQLVPFAVLGPADGRTLIERHEIGYLASGRDLVRHLDSEDSGPAELFGDAEFGLVPQLASAPTSNNPKAWERSGGPPVSQLEEYTTARLRDVGAKRLPGTRREVEALRDQLNQHGIASNLNLGPSASETRLKQVRRPRILHLATHGFYIAHAEGSGVVSALSRPLEGFARQGIYGGMHHALAADILGRNPMLRSGLLLAGAQASLNADTTGGDDGIVTALECSALDLWGTELVVLSCCETGLGDIDPAGDGVMGLRRAFAAAGVRQLVLSLWKVDDAKTTALMIRFYEEYLRNGHDAVTAMTTVQRALLGEALEAGRPRPPPAEWASFFVSVQGQAVR